MNSNHKLTSHNELGERTKAVSAMQTSSPKLSSQRLPKLFAAKRSEQETSNSESTKAFSTIYSSMSNSDVFPQNEKQKTEASQSSNKKNISFGKSSGTNQNFEKTRALDLTKLSEPSLSRPSSPEFPAQDSTYPASQRVPHVPTLDTDKTAAIQVPENLKQPITPLSAPNNAGNLNTSDNTVSNDAIITLSNHDVDDIEKMINEDLDIDISKTTAIPVPPQETSEEEIGTTVSFSPIEDNFEKLPPDAPTRSDEALNFEELHFIEKEENRWRDAKQYQLPSIGDNIDNYTIIEELGRGSFGAVYKAKNITLGREEALKLILPSAKTEFEDIEKRFEREINIVSRLEHPNIVRLYNSGKLPQGILWMTMELVQGERVDQRIKNKGPFKYADARNFMLQLLSGLREAHKRQIVHRDLKPANIMLQQKEGYPDQVVILDFGLSKGLSPADNNNLQNLTQMSSKKVFGTPQYMAPEQLRMKSIGPWTDVYAAGLIFYELIVGKRAFDGKTLFEVVHKQYYEEISLPQYLHNTAIEAVIQKACAKSPEQRYKNASEFYDAVNHLGDIYSPSPDSSNTTKDSDDTNVPNPRGPQKNLETVVYASSPAMGLFKNNAAHPNSLPQPNLSESVAQAPEKRKFWKNFVIILLVIIIIILATLVIMLFLDAEPFHSLLQLSRG